MKEIALVFITLAVGTLATPRQIFGVVKQERLVTGQITKAIENFSQKIKDVGMDPWNVTGVLEIQVPIPVLFGARAFIDTSVTGLSNIAINSMNYSVLTNTLSFDLSLPKIDVNIGDSGFNVTLLGDNYAGSVRGRVIVTQPRVTGEVRVSVGLISGITIRSISLNFTLEGIESNVSLNLLGNDLSDLVNSVLSERIPAKLAEFQNEINELLVIIAWQVAGSRSITLTSILS